MKVKRAFITNSSSSSFIVIWDKKLEKQDLDLIKDKVLYSEKARVVLDDSLEQTPILISSDRTFASIAHEIIGLMVCEGAYYHPYDTEELEEWLQNDNNKINITGKYIYYYHYSDDGGRFWNDMEHGGTFDNLPHLTISHH